MQLSAELAAPLTVAFATSISDASHVLAPPERRICASLGSVGRKSDWLAGRMAAKQAIARSVGLHDPGRVELRSREGMPPAAFARSASGETRSLPIALSITHRDGRAVAAVARRSMRVGVDLERSGSVQANYLRYFLTLAELRGGDRYAATELWAMKEAAWKALGGSARLPFSAVVLRFRASGFVAAVSIGCRTFCARGSLLRPWPGFVCAMVVVGGRA